MQTLHHALVCCTSKTVCCGPQIIQKLLHYSLEGLLPPVVESIELQSARFVDSTSAVIPCCHLLFHSVRLLIETTG